VDNRAHVSGNETFFRLRLYQNDSIMFVDISHVVPETPAIR